MLHLIMHHLKVHLEVHLYSDEGCVGVLCLRIERMVERFVTVMHTFEHVVG